MELIDLTKGEDRSCFGLLVGNCSVYIIWHTNAYLHDTVEIIRASYVYSLKFNIPDQESCKSLEEIGAKVCFCAFNGCEFYM